ncbi:MAG: hypothetical protein ACTHKH_12410 [Trinickia sp.]
MTAASTVGLLQGSLNPQLAEPQAAVLPARRSRSQPVGVLPRALTGLEDVRASTERSRHRPQSAPQSNASAVAPAHHDASIASVAATSEASEPADLAAMKEALDELFKPYRLCCPEEARARELESFIASRAQELVDMEETAEDFANVMSKGDALDMAYRFAEGWVRSLGFGAIAAALDKFPELTSFSNDPAKKGAVAGAYSQIADFGWVKLIGPVLNDTLWLDRGEGALESQAMEEALKRFEPTTWRRSGEVALYAQAFSARNILKVLIAPFLPPEACAGYLSIMGSAGSAFAGAFMRFGDFMNQRDKHRLGAAVMLAREDWRKVYLELKSYHPITGPMGGLARRLSRVPCDVLTPTHVCEVARSLLGTDSLATGATLIGGFSANDAAVSAISAALASDSSMSPFTRVLMVQVINALSMAPVYSLWSMLGVIGDPERVKPVATSALDGVRSTIGAVWNTASAAAQRWVPQRLVPRRFAWGGEAQSVWRQSLVEGTEPSGASSAYRLSTLADHSMFEVSFDDLPIERDEALQAVRTASFIGGVPE